MWKFEWWSFIPVLESYPYEDAVVVAGCGNAAFVEYGVYVGAFVYPVHSAAPIKLFSAMTQSTVIFLATKLKLVKRGSPKSSLEVIYLLFLSKCDYKRTNKQALH